VVRVTQPEITRAQIISHPRVLPLPQTAGWGNGWGQPAAPGRPAVQRPVVTPRPRPEIHVTPWKNPQLEQPVQTGQPVPTGQPIRERIEPQRPPGVPTPRPGAPTRQLPPRVIARNPPAPAALPFPTRQKAMQQTDPGRPLEPVQRQNLRQGKPAGPHRDPEDPGDHRAVQPAKKPQPPAKKPVPQRPAPDKP